MAHQVQVHLHVVQAKVRRSYALRSNPDTGEFSEIHLKFRLTILIPANLRKYDFVFKNLN